VIRLGFLGVGWIGRDRMRALVASGLAEAALVADASPAVAEEVAAEVGAQVVAPDELLRAGLDGVVIATPSALHAQQSIAALDAGSAVFCQKPLGRDAAETAAVVDAARRNDRLLGVDLSYRHLAATEALRGVLSTGELGEVYAAEPGLPQRLRPGQAVVPRPGAVRRRLRHRPGHAPRRPRAAPARRGGPAVDVESVTARLFTGGRPLDGRTDVVEDSPRAHRPAGGTC
jgi:predicted dehydrogenase